jgi:ATP-binding cassette subfamily F protein 3
LVANGEITPFDGDLDDYRRRVLSQPDKDTERPPPDGAAPRLARADIRRAAAEKRIELAPLRRRVTEAEAAIARLAKEMARIDAALAEPGLFARDPATAARLAKARADAAAGLARAEDDWLAASTAIETAMV